VTVSQIAAANPGVDPNRLQVGQQICIPGVEPPPTECPAGTSPYIIQAGDTFFGLAQRFGVTVNDIIAANPGVDPNRLRVGQQICIPEAVQPPTPEFPVLCSFILDARPDGPSPNAGGVVWVRRLNRVTQVLVAVMGLPNPSRFGVEMYTADLTWDTDSFELPLVPVEGVRGGWMGFGTLSLPAEFFETGRVEVNPGSIVIGMVENCR